MSRRPDSLAPAVGSTSLKREAKQQRAEIDTLIDTIERAGIHGRGGGSFPTGTKLRAVASQKWTPAVVINGAEGEPLSHKDRYLLNDHVGTVLDGALAVGSALRAGEVVFALDQRLGAEARQISSALTSRPQFAQRGLLVRVAAVPSGYVTGQETALVSALSGGQPKPTFTPPYPFQRGLRGAPTFVSNVETFSQIGRAVQGTYDGSRLVTVAGAVAEPGVVTINAETSLGELLQAVGGPAERIRGVLLGGYGGSWASPDQLATLQLEEFKLRERGLTLGAGIVVLLGDSTCPVAEVAHVTSWMASQSAGQCGPCVRGVGAIAGALTELTSPGTGSGSYRRIKRWAEMIEGRGACAHPDGVSRFVISALTTFREDFRSHAEHGRCARCVDAGVLPTPRLRRPAAAQRDRRTPMMGTRP